LENRAIICLALQSQDQEESKKLIASAASDKTVDLKKGGKAAGSELL